MGKYSNVETNVYEIFGTPEWRAEDIRTFPGNYVGSNVASKYIRVNIIPSGPGCNRISGSGVVMIDIFVAAGEGTKALTEIADKLDLYLCNKAFKVGTKVSTQLFNSSFQPRGIDTVNAGLFKGVYSIPFNYSEVL